MKYQVVLPVFEGPLDLLLHLIDKNELDIYNIPVAFITSQYIEYMEAAKEIDLSLSSEFIVMAGTLLAIKARMLLPKRPPASEEEEDIDPRDELVEKLIEYRIYKKAAARLRELAKEEGLVYYREVNDKQLLELFPPPNPVGKLTVKDLTDTFIQLIRNLDKRQKSVQLPKDEITLQQQANFIMNRLQNRPQGVSFQSLMAGSNLRVMVTTFLALLELIHKNKVWVRQPVMYGDIRIYPAGV